MLMFAYHVQFNPTVPFMFDRDYEKKKKPKTFKTLSMLFCLVMLFNIQTSFQGNEECMIKSTANFFR